MRYCKKILLSQTSHRWQCWIPKATNTHSECVICIASSIATLVAQTCLTHVLYVCCQSCSYLRLSHILFWQERQCHINNGRYPEKLLRNFFIPFLNVTAAKIAAEFLTWQSGPFPCKINQCWKVPIYSCKGMW
jgi:hypothetical protein